MVSISAILANDDMDSAGSQCANARDLKQFTIMLISQKLTEYVYLLCKFICCRGEIPSLMVFFSAIMTNCDMDGADLQIASAANVKKFTVM